MDRQAVVFALLIAAVASCDDGGPAGPASSVMSISIAPETADFGAVGSTVQFTATPLGPGGLPVEGALIVWRTAGTGVADVDATGLATSVGNGVERIVASAGDVETSVEVSVSQVPTAVSHETSSELLERVGATLALRPFSTDSNGVAVTQPSSFTYESSAPATVSVDVDGVLLANAFGAAAITIGGGEHETIVEVEVAAPGPYEPVIGGEIPCAGGRAAQFACDRIDLVAFVPLAGLGASPGIGVSDVWGWRDTTTMREYALVARDDGTAFVEVTDPVGPRTIGFLRAAGGPAGNRDVKVYGNHAYVVADPSPGHGVQVFDLTRLRGVTRFTTFTEDFRYIDVSSVHNISVIPQTGFAFAVGAQNGGVECGGGLHMIDLSDPVRPSFAGCFSDNRTGAEGTGYTVDAQCVVYEGPDAAYAGREICFGSNQTALSIADVTDKGAPIPISVAADPTVGYASQGWLSDDHRYFFQANELDEIQMRENGALNVATRTFVWDVQDLAAPVLAAVFGGPAAATDAVQYVFGSRLYQANSAFGLRVVDVADPSIPVSVGSFDTYALDDLPGFFGASGAYPFLDNGLVLVSSREEGLFVLRPQP